MGEDGDTTTSCTGKRPLASEHGIRVTQAGRDLGGLCSNPPSQSKETNLMIKALLETEPGKCSFLTDSLKCHFSTSELH